jgi:hypothetical protein
MATRLVHVVIDALDFEALARFWSSALAWPLIEEYLAHDEGVVRSSSAPDLELITVPASTPKTEKNRLHLDLVSESAGHQAEMVESLVSLGARRVDVGQPDEADHVVLADPEGNEFCVVRRGEFLANTGLLGAIAFEPAEPVTGYFWSAAAGWPVVYDEDGDVAIRHPSGQGPFITFGPPGVPPKQAKNRVHLDVAPTIDDDHAAEVERLIDLGARPVDIGQGEVRWVVLADPDGNEFCVLSPR